MQCPRRQNRFSGLAALFLIALSGFNPGCTSKESGNVERITLAAAAMPISAPVFVAQANGYFEQEGLQVELNTTAIGKEALQAVTSGKAQFCMVADTPILFAALRGEKIYVLANLADTKTYVAIVARKDRGIAGPQDLVGKRIGINPGTSGEYFLHAYLIFNGIPEDRIRKVEIKPLEMAAALARGEVDATVSWDPHLTEQRRALGAEGVTLSNDLIFRLWWNLVAAQDFVRTHPETVRKVLRALIRAQRYMEESPNEARRIMATYVNEGAGTLDDFNFDVRLSQSLILTLEEQARWAIKAGLTDRREVPNFLPLMYTEGMEAIAPESVSVVHR
jgi:NitT/TauT family transport system substrate-binding protein